jgi:hypothetical protein
MAVAGGQLHKLGTCPFKLSTLEPSTQEQLREEGQSLMLGLGVIVVTCHAAHMARVWCKAGIKCLSQQRNEEAPLKLPKSAVRNLWVHVIKWEDMGCTVGTTPRYLLLPRMHETQKPSISQGLYHSYC